MTTTLHMVRCPSCSHECELPMHVRQHRCECCHSHFDVLAVMFAAAAGEARPRRAADDSFEGVILRLADPGVLIQAALGGLFGGILSGVGLGITESAIRASSEPNTWISIAVIGGAIGGFLWGFVLGTLAGVGVALAAHKIKPRVRVPAERAAVLSGTIAGLPASLFVAGLHWLPAGLFLGAGGGFAWLFINHRLRPHHFRSLLNLH
jgi:hypothetical protein